MSHPLLIILKASRPLGWIFGPILYIIGIIHSRVYPRTPAALALAALQIFSLSLPLCIVVFGVNDVYDYQSDLVNPRKIAAGLEGGILPPQYHAMVLKVSYLSAIFVVAVGILSRQWGTIIATLSLIFLGFQYSSPPLRLKEVPVIDSITNGVIVFLCWFIGLTARGAIQHPSLRRKGFVIGLVVSAIHALGASVDIESDMAAGQRTIATLLGPRLTAVVGVLAYVVAIFIDENSPVFAVYLTGGAFLMLIAAIQPVWTHKVFLVIGGWTLGMAGIWFGSKLLGSSR